MLDCILLRRSYPPGLLRPWRRRRNGRCSGPAGRRVGVPSGRSFHRHCVARANFLLLPSLGLLVLRRRRGRTVLVSRRKRGRGSSSGIESDGLLSFGDGAMLQWKLLSCRQHSRADCALSGSDIVLGDGEDEVDDEKQGELVSIVSFPGVQRLVCRKLQQGSAMVKSWARDAGERAEQAQRESL